MADEVRNLFDGKADYDEKRDKYYFERRTRELEKILVNLSRGAKILDLGCGTGITVDFLSRRGFLDVYGCDISTTLLEIGKRKGIKNLFLIEEVVLPFPSHSFDFVTMFDVIEHMDNYGDNLREIFRVLKPGGVVFISYPNPGMVWLLDVMAALGLKIPGKENKIPLNELENVASSWFRMEYFRPIVLISKLPRVVLNFFETLEKTMPISILKRVALCYCVVLKKEDSKRLCMDGGNE
ncbi:MAG: hypothetical protein A2W61_03220 [Deltaproteobacteria bacterium RIFCSPLOWO2_01_44_7]|nr:MAG: hypothetical protein A2712_02700 [Deltaproteobacteria bacterium RIFCSPHIGHO2_01_FULL_43_49]OGQ16105.1 MAG: hypothetical protein A3D22_00670 [Deltaproteobacteria bacterium RIFCSPHIGHO2_02_FULL_44_53]OGQ29066.1 MAG: hypothetical protein A3D98_04455 [Deltaproteobacteria bacterium RIFCSPHIGHO2_12_FULL_44_21]OGQ32622.1 MAG: hypothetical protein A2979_08600 [Deltaproteobacteria bacterium RIFCSPLOWO2_01_FULL_45_74]OGQ38364.1 MAG: hypothetical protein A2W61_03220 [Deltaproteobacteria bacterium 